MSQPMMYISFCRTHHRLSTQGISFQNIITQQKPKGGFINPTHTTVGVWLVRPRVKILCKISTRVQISCDSAILYNQPQIASDHKICFPHNFNILTPYQKVSFSQSFYSNQNEIKYLETNYSPCRGFNNI